MLTSAHDVLRAPVMRLPRHLPLSSFPLLVLLPVSLSLSLSTACSSSSVDDDAAVSEAAQTAGGPLAVIDGRKLPR